MRPRTGSGPARYQEIMRKISDDISSGRIPVGQRLPTEEELGVLYEAGRHTIREAVRCLVELGMVERRPRLGTTVISAEPVASYRWLPVTSEEVATNIRASWIVRPRGAVVTTDAALAARLGCAVDEKWFRLAGPRILRDRRRRAPVCFSEQYVRDTPQARDAIVNADIANRPWPDQIIEQEIRADLLDEEQAEALHAERGSAALVVVRRHFRPDGELVAVGIHTHPSDRFSIRMTLPVDGSEGHSDGQQSG
jgi:GntR family transcriptional regulator